MTRFALCWNRTGGRVPIEVQRRLGAALGAVAASEVREVAGTDWVGWCAPSSWVVGAEDALPLALGGWTGTGALRLDDRESLSARVRDRVGDGPNDDASLAWRSFAGWDAAAPSQWLGDYALAAIAPDRDRLVITRGTLGVLHCFHACAGDLVVVADDPAIAATVPGVDVAIDERAVAEYLATGELITPTVTFRRGVTRVPAAHTVVVRRDGRVERWRHWELPAPAERVGARREALLEEFAETLGRSVRERLRGSRATLLLSGGVDSALLAATIARAGDAPSVSALTVSWERLLPGDDESRWAARTAASARLPHMVHSMAPDEGFASATDTYLTPEPAPDPEPRLSRAVARQLAAHGGIAISGEDPDALLTPQTLVEQVRAHGVGATLAAWRRFRRETGGRPWIGLRRSVPALERLRERRSRHAPRWLRRDLLAHAPLPPTPADPPHPTRALAARALAQPSWENSLWNDAPQMSGSPVQVVLPYMDPRVIAFLFSLPAVPWAQRKHVIREALRGVVDQALIERPKTPLAGYYDARMRRWRDSGADAPLAGAVESWVDLARWRRALEPAASAEEVFAAFRVCELSRWLGQPPAGVR